MFVDLVEQQVEVVADERMPVDRQGAAQACRRAGAQRMFMDADHDERQHQRVHRGVDIDIAELAAWTTVANVLLNLDEFITRE